MHKRIRSSQIIGEGVGLEELDRGSVGVVRDESLLNFYCPLLPSFCQTNSWYYTILDHTI